MDNATITSICKQPQAFISVPSGDYGKSCNICNILVRYRCSCFCQRVDQKTRRCSNADPYRPPSYKEGRRRAKNPYIPYVAVYGIGMGNKVVRPAMQTVRHQKCRNSVQDREAQSPRKAREIAPFVSSKSKLNFSYEDNPSRCCRRFRH